jgi:hypothetical protein
MGSDPASPIWPETDDTPAAVAIDGVVAHDPHDARPHASRWAINSGADVPQRGQVIDFKLSLHHLGIATRDEHLRAQHLRFVRHKNRRDTCCVHEARAEQQSAYHQAYAAPSDPRHFSSANRALTSRFTSPIGSGLSSGNCTVPVDIL